MKETNFIDEMFGSEEEKELAKAVIEQYGDFDDMCETAKWFQSADQGVNGFIYYKDTYEFFHNNHENILLVHQFYFEEMGEDTATYPTDRNPENHFSWFALEYVMYKLTDYVEYHSNDDDEEEEE